MADDPRELLARMNVETPPTVLKILDAAHREIAALERNRELRPEIVRQKIQTIRATTLAKVEAERKALVEAAVKRVEQDAAQIKFKARGDHLRVRDIDVTESDKLHAIRRELHEARRATEVQTDIALIREATAPDQIRAIYDTWALTDDPAVVERIGAAAEQALDRLVRVAQRRLGTGDPNPVRPALAAVQEHRAAFRQAHPSPLDQLRRLERDRESAGWDIERAVTHAVRAYGYERPGPDGIVRGGHFDDRPAAVAAGR